MEVSRLGVQLELQLPAYTAATATRDPSCVCDLHHSLWQHQILNPLTEAGYQTCTLMDARQIHFHWATLGTPLSLHFILWDWSLGKLGKWVKLVRNWDRTWTWLLLVPKACPGISPYPQFSFFNHLSNQLAPANWSLLYISAFAAPELNTKWPMTWSCSWLNGTWA